MNDEIKKIWEYMRENYDDIPDSLDKFVEALQKHPQNIDIVYEAIKGQFPEYGSKEDLNRIVTSTLKKKEPSAVSGQLSGGQSKDGVQAVSSPIVKQETPTEQQGQSNSDEDAASSFIVNPIKPFKDWDLNTKRKVREYNELLSDISVDLKYSGEVDKLKLLSPELRGALSKGAELAKTETNQKILKAKTIQDELVSNGIIPESEDKTLKWVNNSPLYGESPDVQFIEKTNYFLDGAMRGSVIWQIAELASSQIPSSVLPDKVNEIGSEIDEFNYAMGQTENFSKPLQYLQTGISFLFDYGIFKGASVAGSSISAAAMRPMVNYTTKSLVKAGVNVELAETLAAKSVSQSLVGKAAVGAVTSGVTLGAYDALGNTVKQLNDYVDEGGSVESFNFVELLHDTAKGATLGAAVGVVSPLFSRWSDMATAGIENKIARSAIKLGIAVPEFTTETAIFAGIGAALDNRMPGMEDVVDAAGTLLAIKVTNLPGNLKNRFVKAEKKRPVEYTELELKRLGVSNPNEIKGFSDERAVSIMRDSDIPLVTKYKVAYDLTGLYPKGTLYATDVEVDGNTVREYRDIDGKRELLNEVRYDDRGKALEHYTQATDGIADMSYRLRMDRATPEQYDAYKREMDALNPEQREKMLDALDTPVDARTSEQRNMVRAWREIVDRVAPKGEVKPEVKVEPKAEEEVSKESVDNSEVSQSKEKTVDEKTVAPVEQNKGEVADVKETKDLETEKPVETKEETPNEPKGIAEQKVEVDKKNEVEHAVSGELVEPTEAKSEAMSESMPGSKPEGKPAEPVVDKKIENRREKDAEAVRSNEGQVLQGVPEERVKSERSPEESTGKGSENIQQPAQAEVEPQAVTKGKKGGAIKEPLEVKLKSEIKTLKDLVDGLKKQIASGATDERRNRNAIDAFLKKNWRQIGRLDKRLVRRAINTVVSRSPVEEKVKELDRIVSDSEYARRVIEVADSAQKLKNTIRGVNVKKLKETAGKTKFKDNNLIVRLGKVNVEKLPEEMFDEYEAAVREAGSKSPNQKIIKDFLNKYYENYKEAEIREQVKDVSEGKDAGEQIQERITYLDDLIDKAETGELEGEAGSATSGITYIKRIKTELNKLNKELREMRKNGLVEVDEKGNLRATGLAGESVDVDVKKEVQRLVDRYNSFQVNVKRDIVKKALESEPSFISQNDEVQFETLKRKLERIERSDWALWQLSIKDMEAIEDIVSFGKMYDVMPVSWHKATQRLGAIDMADSVKRNLHDVIDKLNKPKETWAKLNQLAEDLKNYISGNIPIRNIQVLELDEIFKPVNKALNNPIYNFLYRDGIGAIRKRNKMVEDMLSPVNNVLFTGKSKGGAVGKVTTFFKKNIYELNKSHDEKEGALVGIVMRQLAAIENINSFMRRRITKTKDGYVAVDPNGTPLKDDSGNNMYFNTFEEAYEYSQKNIVRVLGNGRPIDAYALTRWEIDENGNRVNSQKYEDAKFSNSPGYNKYLKETFDEAYSILLERARKKGLGGEDLSGITTDEQALELLEGREKELYKAIKEGYEKMMPVIEAVGDISGKPVITRDSYYPEVAFNDERLVTEHAERSIEYTNRVLAKGIYLHYTNVDAVSTYSQYVNDVATSYHVKPVMDMTMEALDILKDNTPQARNFITTIRNDIADGYTLFANNKSMFGNAKVVVNIGEGKNKVVHVSEFAKSLAQSYRNVTLGSYTRVINDLTPNLIKYGKDAFTMEDMSRWDEFFERNPDVRGAAIYNESNFGRWSFGGFENKRRQARMEQITAGIPAIGDNIPSKRAWINMFQKSYETFAGKRFDLDKYFNDSEYRRQVENSDEWKKAIGVADGYVDDITVPDTPLSSAKNMVIFGHRIMSSGTNAYKAMSTMARYNANESLQLMASMRGLGGKSSGLYADRIARLIAANVAFNYGSNFLYNAIQAGVSAYTEDDRLFEQSISNIKDLFTFKSFGSMGALAMLQLVMGQYVNVGRIFGGVFYGAYKTVRDIGADSKEKYKHKLEYQLTDRYASRLFMNLGKLDDNYVERDALAGMMGFYGSKAYLSGNIAGDVLGGVVNRMLMTPEERAIAEPMDKGDYARLSNIILFAGWFPETRLIDVAGMAVSRGFIPELPAKKEVHEAYYGIKRFRLTAMDAASAYRYKAMSLENEYRNKGTIKGEHYTSDPNEPFMDEARLKIKDISKLAMQYYLDRDDNKYLYTYYKVCSKSIDRMEKMAIYLQTDKTIPMKERLRLWDVLVKENKALEENYNYYREHNGELKDGVLWGISDEFNKEYINLKIDDYFDTFYKKYGGTEELMKAFEDIVSGEE